MTNGFLRVAAASPHVSVASVAENVNNILAEARRLDASGVDIAVFPEMCVTGYTCADLFHNQTLLDDALRGLDALASASKQMDIDFVVGLPMVRRGALRNCAAFISHGSVSIVEKSYLPNYNEFYERRWFAPSESVAQPQIFRSHGVDIAIEICEDLWVAIPPSSQAALAGAEVVLNLSASDDVIGKHAYLESLIRQQSARLLCGYVYASAGWGESSTDLVFSPKDIIAECGSIVAQNNRFDCQLRNHHAIADIDIAAIRRDRLHTTTFADCARRNGIDSVATAASPSVWDSAFIPKYRKVEPMPFVPSSADKAHDRFDEILFIQRSGLQRRIEAVKATTLTVGISGGLDSTLALLVAVAAFDALKIDRKGIIGVTMPGFGTTGRTYRNAIRLMQLLGITIREIPIAEAVNLHFRDIGHDPKVTDLTYENSQARERTQILMDIANRTGGFVLGTGDLSELALGWATYNGDHMSMYGVNAGVPKTLVAHLVRRYAATCGNPEIEKVLLDIADTPISPELTPADDKGDIAQKTEELVGPYILHDFFLYYMLRYGFSPRRIFTLARAAFDGSQYTPQVILRWMREFFRRFFAQQFKRSCLPDGPKVGSVCLSPRGDWRMPSDASSKAWLAEVDSMILEFNN